MLGADLSRPVTAPCPGPGLTLILTCTLTLRSKNSEAEGQMGLRLPSCVEATWPGPSA